MFRQKRIKRKKVRGWPALYETIIVNNKILTTNHNKWRGQSTSSLFLLMILWYAFIKVNISED
jgi:hypothetical protein